MTETTAGANRLRPSARMATQYHIEEERGFADSPVLRALALCLGAAFFVVAVGLWAFAAPDTMIMLIKLGASIFFLGGAAMLFLTAAAPTEEYRLEFDPGAQEIRVLERDARGGFILQRREALSDIGKINHKAGTLRIWGRTGGVLISVPMRKSQARETMRAVLARI